MSYLLPAPGTREYDACFPNGTTRYELPPAFPTTAYKRRALTDAERWAERARRHKRTHPACAATGLPTEDSHHRYGRGLVNPVGSETDDELVPLAAFVHDEITAGHKAYGKRHGWTDGRGHPLGIGDRQAMNREAYQLKAIPRVTRRVVWWTRIRLSVWMTVLNLVAAGWFAVTVGLWVPILAAAVTVIAGPVRRKIAR